MVGKSEVVVRASQGGVGRGIFSSLFLGIIKIFKSRFLISMIVVGVLLFGSITQSIGDRSFKPFLMDFGGRVVAGDLIMAHDIEVLRDSPEEVLDIPQQKVSWAGNFWESVKYYWSVFYFYFKFFASVWFIVIVLSLLYFLVHKFNGEAVGFQDYVWTFVIFWLISLMVTSQLFLADPKDNLSVQERVSYLFPFHGLVSVVKNFSVLAKPFGFLKTYSASYVDASYNLDEGSVGGGSEVVRV